MIKDAEETQDGIDQLLQNKQKDNNISVESVSIDEKDSKTDNDKNISNKNNNEKQPVPGEYESEHQAQNVLDSQQSLIYSYALKCVLTFLITGILFWGPSSLRGKSRRPLRAQPPDRPLVIVKACSQLLPVSVPERVQYPKGLVRSAWNSSLSSLIVSIYEKSYFEI